MTPGDPWTVSIFCVWGGLWALLSVAKAVARRGAVPRGAALRQTSWRDLCLLRSDRLPRWPALLMDFERCRFQWGPCPEDATATAPPEPEGEQDLTEPISDFVPVVWDSFRYLNAKFFGSKLQVDEIRVDAGLLDAEACVRVDFSGDFTRAWLVIEFSGCRPWTKERMISVLLHELVHVWHDTAWTRLEHLLIPHSTEFLRKCARLNALCHEQALPFFPNVFTESWVLLVQESVAVLGLDVERWTSLLRWRRSFEGSFLEDLQSLGVAYEEVMAAKRQLNAGHISQAQHLSYEGLQSWRRAAAKVFMHRLARGDEKIFIRSDYVLVPRSGLLEVAKQEGHEPCHCDTLLCSTPFGRS